jgi:hypothetical protein
MTEWLAPTPLQRIEGAAILVFALVAYGVSGQRWWWFALLLLIPDLTITGYLLGPAIGAATYNVGHTLLWPLLLLALGWWKGRPLLLGLAAVWLAHIGMDRFLGYGLKLRSGFQDTHLGPIGRQG